MEPRDDGSLRAVNVAAVRARNAWLALVACAGLLAAAPAPSDADLLVDRALRLPLLQLEFSLRGAYILGPLLLVLLLAWLLVWLRLLGAQLDGLRSAAPAPSAPAGVGPAVLPAELHGRLHPLVWLHGGLTDAEGPVLRGVLRALYLATVVALPVVVLLLLQARFLPYQSAGVTWWHRLLVLTAVALLWALAPAEDRHGSFAGAWLRALARRDAPDAHLRSGSLLPRASTAVALLSALAATVLALGLSLCVFTRPGEFHWPARFRPVPNRLAVAGYSGLELDGGRPLRLARRSLRGADLHGSDLRRADLRGARLTGADLTGADLASADLSGARAARVRLSDAHLEGVRAGCAHAGGRLDAPAAPGAGERLAVVGGSSFEGRAVPCVNLTGGSLDGARLAGADLAGARLMGAELVGAHLEGASLAGARLDNADLRGAHLEGADLAGASLAGALLLGAHLEAADLAGAHLEAAVLFGAHLEGARFVSAHLAGADVREAAVWRSEFQRAQMEHLDLARANPGCLTGGDVEGLRQRIPIGTLPAQRSLAVQARLLRLGGALTDCTQLPWALRDVLPVESSALAAQLTVLACGADGAPTFARGLIQRSALREPDTNYSVSEFAAAVDKLQRQGKCPGLQGLDAGERELLDGWGNTGHP
jgi:uncharacterized protein YjbI with pentapeptide repeats